jgi:magnesium transporter
MLARKKSQKIGLAPGSLVYIGKQKDAPVRISILDYDADRVDELLDVTIQEAWRFKEKKSVTWINISGVHDMAVIENIGRRFDLHPLLLEDVVNTGGRPKIDDYEDYLFVVLKMVYSEPVEHELVIEHVCVVVGQGYILSFQEREGDIFDPVRERIKKGKGRIRRSGADYLAYSLMDMIVDHYFAVLEDIGEDIGTLQEEALEAPTTKTIQRIHEDKRRIMFLRKSIWPLRDMINMLLRGESPLINQYVMVYLKDVYDHVIQVIDTVETYRDLLAGVMDIYMSSVSNRMNEVMKELTVIATLFIPLTFIAGIYGMNFRYMPELEWRFSYPVFWMLVILVFGIMLILFKRKKWL